MLVLLGVESHEGPLWRFGSRKAEHTSKMYAKGGPYIVSGQRCKKVTFIDNIQTSLWIGFEEKGIR